MACSSSCRTQDHASYGECMRSKGIKVRGESVQIQARADKELSRYAELRKQGIQPKSTKMRDIQVADAISNETGAAFDAAGE